MASTIDLKLTLHGPVEFRVDPLTNDRTRINPARARRPKQGETGQTSSALQEIIDRSATNCVFCPERILEKVPRFPAEIKTTGEVAGLFMRGESIIFPNIGPIGDNHAVGVSTKKHFLKIEEHTPELIKDNILAMFDFVSAVKQAHPAAVWPGFFWNYMPPSAGSVIHPHSQLLVEEGPMGEVARVEALAKAYYTKHNSNYYKDLLALERAKGERYVGATAGGAVEVITAFAPRAFNETWFVLPGISHIMQLSPQVAEEFADAVHRVLKGYAALDVGSFNMACFSGPMDAELPHFSLHFKLFSRPKPVGLYTNDTGPCERVMSEWVIDTIPEYAAGVLKQVWNGETPTL